MIEVRGRPAKVGRLRRILARVGIVALLAGVLVPVRLVTTTVPAGASVLNLELVVVETLADSTSYKEADADCGLVNKLYLGGGASVVDGGGRVALQRMTPVPVSPVSPSRHYTAAARELSGPDYTGNWKLRVYAICGDRPAGLGLEVVTRSESPVRPAPQYNDVTVACPAGKKVLATGFAIIGAWTLNDGLRDTVEWIRPAADGSSLTVRTVHDNTFLPPGPNFTINATAVCVNPLPGYEIVATGTQLQTGSFQHVESSCPSGKELLGVGLTKSDASGNLHVDGVYPDLSTNQAKVEARRYGSNPSGTAALGAWALCVDVIAPPPPPPPLVITSLTCGSDALRYSCNLRYSGGGPTVTIDWDIDVVPVDDEHDVYLNVVCSAGDHRIQAMVTSGADVVRRSVTQECIDEAP